MSPSYSAISVHSEAAVATVTLSRPDALNAITPEMLGELGETFAALAADPEIAVVVLTGEGRAFSAGVDLKALGDRSLAGGKVGDVLDVPARAVIDLIGGMDAVVIAAVNGHCFTGALELALACDVMVVAEEAKLGDTHAKWGLRPTWGMSQRLPRAVGPARARYLSYTATTFTGAQAAEWGMAVRACPRAELDEVVAELARAIAANSRAAVAACKDLHRATERSSLVDGLAYEATAEYEIHDTEDRVAAFR